MRENRWNVEVALPQQVDVQVTWRSPCPHSSEARIWLQVGVGATSGPQAPWPGVSWDTVGTMCRSRAARGKQRERPGLDGDLSIGIRLKGGATQSSSAPGKGRCMLDAALATATAAAAGPGCFVPAAVEGVGEGGKVTTFSAVEGSGRLLEYVILSETALPRRTKPVKRPGEAVSGE